MIGVLQCLLIQRVGKYKVQKQARVKTGRTRKRRMQKAGEWGKPLVDLETYKTNWHRDRKHRDKYTEENK
jgi:hypothetical protein